MMHRIINLYCVPTLVATMYSAFNPYPRLNHQKKGGDTYLIGGSCYLAAGRNTDLFILFTCNPPD